MQVATPDIGAVHHSCTPIYEDSRQLPYLPEYAPRLDVFARKSVDEIIRHREWIKGATACLNKKMLLKYGRLNEDVVNEDNVLGIKLRRLAASSGWTSPSSGIEYMGTRSRRLPTRPAWRATRNRSCATRECGWRSTTRSSMTVDRSR